MGRTIVRYGATSAPPPPSAAVANVDSTHDDTASIEALRARVDEVLRETSDEYTVDDELLVRYYASLGVTVDGDDDAKASRLRALCAHAPPRDGDGAARLQYRDWGAA